MSTSGGFILQKAVSDFELGLANYTDSNYAVGVGNATDGMEIFLEAIGLAFVRLTFLSRSLSTTSLKIHPALLIKTDPKKNKIKCLEYTMLNKSKLYARDRPHEHGQNKSIKPIGLFNLVSSMKIFI